MIKMKIELDNTEEKLVRSAFQILQKEGVAKTTVKRVADGAGFNEVTVMRRFGTKDNLIQTTKDYYMQSLLCKLENNFSFDGDEEIEEYLKSCFYGILDFTEDDFSIVKVAVQEVDDTPDKKRLIAQITDTIIDKMEAFFKLQLEKGEIKDVNPKALSIMCFGIIFQSLILWQIYGNSEIGPDFYAEDLLNIIFNGIKR